MKTIEHQLTIPESLASQRLDKALAEVLPQYSRAKLVEWLKNGEILINGQVLAPKVKVQGLESVQVKAQLQQEETHRPEPIELDIVFEDEHILVLNKKAGQVVHPAAGHHDGTLLNGLLHHAPILSTLPRAGIVHRLDKDTTGLMVVAKSLEAHHQLVKLLHDREIDRHYFAICNGYMIAGKTIETQFGRHPVNRLKMAVVKEGKPAITHIRVAQRFKAHTLVDVKLQTGRTHQIRVHMSHIKYPLVGDPLYGGRNKLPTGCDEALRETLSNFKRQALHAYQLKFAHPISQAPLSFEAPMPDDMLMLINQLKRSEQASL